MAVHYAGVGAALDPIMSFAKRRGLMVIEDAAQGDSATYAGRPLGALELGCLSFQKTKDVVSGECGALLINDPALVERAQFIREEKNELHEVSAAGGHQIRVADIGPSFLLSGSIAAVLLARLERGDEIALRC